MGSGAQELGRRARWSWPGRGRMVLAAVVAAAAAGLAGCGTGPSVPTSSKAAGVGPAVVDASPGPGPSAADPHQADGAGRHGPSTIATAVHAAVPVFPAPGGGAPLMRLSNPTEDGGPRVLLVVGGTAGWWQVLLPVQPNGSTGWVRDAEVTIATTGYRIDVARRAHRLRVYDGDRLVADEPIAVGTADTPTPGGRYYLTELLRPPDPAGLYGPYAYGLSGYSTTLKSFAGGLPVIGIHGTDQPQLLGHDVSHGCIRMSNAAITRLSRILPLGTPVNISR